MFSHFVIILAVTRCFSISSIISWPEKVPGYLFIVFIGDFVVSACMKTRSRFSSFDQRGERGCIVLLCDYAKWLKMPETGICYSIYT